MSRMKKFIERQKKLSRFQALKSIFSSLLMTVTVVVIAVVVVPSSPKGEITDIDVFSDSVIYTVNITDYDSAILPDTLQMKLENQFEVYYHSLKVGDDTGYFEGLQEETKYTLKILADKGFGLEVLDSITFTTWEATGGALTGIELISPEEEYLLSYDVSYIVHDPFDEYKSIQLRYGLKYEYEEEVFSYQTIILDEIERSTILSDIYNSNAELHIYLEAINQSDEVIELDYLVIRTPYQLYGSMNVFQLSYNQISISVWGEMIAGLDIEYEVILKRNYQEIDRVKLKMEFSEEDMHHEGLYAVFERLSPEVTYTIILQANYRDPYTMEMNTKELDSLEVTTLMKFNYDISVVETETQYEVIITVDDLHDFYDVAYASIYEDSDWGVYQTSHTEYSYQYIDDQYVFSFVIDKPLTEAYRIEFGILDNSQYYNYTILETVGTLEEGN